MYASQLRYHRIPDGQVNFYLIPTNDVWARDNGPIFVTDQNGKQVITNWGFNGWGGRFEGELDNQVPAKAAKAMGLPMVSPSLFIEGGAVEVDGKGNFMATRTSIIDPNRNPGLSQQEIEAVFSQYFGVDRFIWLTGAGPGVCEKWGDTTNSHIDLIARFTPQSAILYSCSEDSSDPRTEMHTRHLAELEQQVDILGLDYQLIPLPEPAGGVYQISRRNRLARITALRCGLQQLLRCQPCGLGAGVWQQTRPGCTGDHPRALPKPGGDRFGLR